MTDTKVKQDKRYAESDDHTPNPTDQYGTLDTSGTAGAAHNQVNEVTPIFEIARKQDLETAAKALDPNDPTPEHLVVLPPSQVLHTADPEKAREHLKKKAEAETKKPVVVGGPTPAQQEAAEADKKSASKQDDK